ncbi:hypothetical protein KDN32_02930 [Nocardioides sp. J2M5]|uniref:hypothetical protein n=1 Tax=Nocardioides palaemonis TaxID=2829810 RepID=UPI001BA63396|nr:hypothetical protein [Nocardioides palaemonis]MBS2936693.1 hypothetical protein [Nocardioides palaemonis]
MFQLSGVATGVLGASGFLAPARAARRRRKVRAELATSTVHTGELLTLTVVERLKQPRRIRVRDDGGLVWTRTERHRRSQVWTATPTEPGTGAVTVVVRRKDGRVFRRTIGYEVLGTEVTVGGTGALIGMSAPAPEWDLRVAQVGAGLGARRIFADLADGADTQLRLVEEAHAAGMLPVISYKVGGDAAGAAAGRFDAVARQAAARLASYGLPTAVSFWHEPYGDLTGAQYAAASRRILPAFRQGEVRVGPILNGWLLDNQLDVFTSFCPDDLFSLWDWFGIDTYESGTMASPGPAKPAQRLPALSAYLAARGHPTMPIGVGEYNGYSAATIAAAGAAILDTPHVWFGCLWNSTESKGHVLEGERLAAFQQTLAAARA